MPHGTTAAISARNTSRFVRFFFGKLHTLDDFWQLVVAVELAPVFLRAVDQLENQGKRRLVGEAALRADSVLAFPELAVKPAATQAQTAAA